MDLSGAFKRFRNEFNQTQKEVAEHANVGVRTYQEYEYGKVVPTATVLIAIAKFYNVSIDYLVGLTDNPNIYR